MVVDAVPAHSVVASGSRARLSGLLILLFAGFALRLFAVVVLGDTHQPDEVFQTLEPAHRLWTGRGVISWEWRDGIRSWALPAVIAGLMRLFSIISDSPRAYLAGVSCVFALSSSLIIYIGYRVGERFFGLTGGLVCGALCVVWPDLMYFGARTLTEAVAAPFLLLAAYLAMFRPATEPESRRRIMYIGFLLGIAFVLRFHLSLALLVVAAWACRIQVRQRWLLLVAAAAVPIVAGGLLDWATLGTPFQAVWKNIWANIVDGRSTDAGVNGRLYFVRENLRELGVAVAPVALCIIVGARRVPLFALCAAAVWLTFSAIPHKEVRFIYPATPLLVITAGLGAAELIVLLQNRFKWRVATGRTIGLAGVLAMVLLTLSGTSSRLMREYALLRGNATDDPYWSTSSHVRAAELAVADGGDVCGLALIEAHWAESGGYSHLHRDAPIYIYRQREPTTSTDEPGPAAWNVFNYAIVKRGFHPPANFALGQCWGETCVYRRDGSCAAGQDDSEVNQVLLKHGY